MKTIENISVFVASPNDVAKERKIVTEVIEELNDTVCKHLGFHITVFKWEDNALGGMGRPQEIITNQCNPNNCNIFIGILWNRFGTGSGAIVDGIEATGTLEEFNLAYENWKIHGRPLIMFYHCNKDIEASKIDLEQYLKVQKFFENFNNDGAHPGLAKDYTSTKEFESKLRKDLITVLFDMYEERKIRNDATLCSKIQQEKGFVHIFTSDSNALRSKRKREKIDSSKTLKLIAHSGQAFFARYAHRYLDLILDNLNKGYKVQAVLTNPWSFSGLLLALGEHDNNVNINSIDDPIKTILNSTWYNRKFLGTLEGYETLLKKYPNQIEIRFTRLEVPASMLILDDGAFLEPYIPIELLSRNLQGTSTYELEVSDKSHLHKLSDEYFNYLWEQSIKYEELKEYEEIDQFRLKNYLTDKTSIKLK